MSFFPYRSNNNNNRNNGNSSPFSNNNSNHNENDDDLTPQNNSLVQLIPSSLFRSNNINETRYTPLTGQDETQDTQRTPNLPPTTPPQPVVLDPDSDPTWVNIGNNNNNGEDDDFFITNANTNAQAAEQARRQRILRLLLILCIVFLFMDGNNSFAPYRKKTDESNEGIPPDEILLPSQDIQDIRAVLLPQRDIHFKRQNVTGYYRAEWKSIVTTHVSSSSVISESSTLSSNDTETSEDEHEGISVMQFKTVNIYNIPDLSFVYGVNRVYENAKVQKDFSYPFQGILLNSMRKVIVVPTLYKTQRLMMEIRHETPTAAPTSSPVEDTHASIIATDQHGRILANTPTNQRKNTFYYNPSDPDLTRNTSIILRHHSLGIQLRIFVQDLSTNPLNFTSSIPTSASTLRTFVLGEAFLSPKFKLLQLTHASPLKVPTARPTTSPSANSSSPSGVGGGGGTVNNAYLNPYCPYYIELTVTDEKNVYGEDVNGGKMTMTPPAMENYPDTSKTASGTSANSAVVRDDAIPHHVTPAVNLAGSVRNCHQRFSMNVISYEAEFDILRGKVEIYSLIYTIISLIQIVLLLFQMKHTATQALCGKLSLLTFLSQAILDAVICLIHLLFATAMPQIFFSSFIWVSIIKLLTFSVFLMKMIINIYQSRYAQDIANEGWRGLRQRIVNLHLRFYAALLIAFILATTFSFRPWVLVLLFYSFWWPQIVYNIIAGTRPSYHPLYFYGNTLLQLFLPLYFMGCPKNFIVIFWEEFSISTDFALAERNNDIFLSDFACYLLIIWLSIQVIVLQAQMMFGSRFCIPKRYLPFTYDYKRPIPNHLLLHHTASTTPPSITPTATSSNNSGLDEETGSTLQSSSGEHFECVICYNPIYNNNVNHSDYMITPCDHLFHDACLRQWMNVKLECPVCRHALPTLDDDE